METKICGKCGIPKSVDEFNYQDKEKGTRISWCKKCGTEFVRTRNNMTHCISCAREITESRLQKSKLVIDK